MLSLPNIWHSLSHIASWLIRTKMLNNFFKKEHMILRYLQKSVLSYVDTMEPWPPSWYFSMWCKFTNHFSICIMFRCEGNSKHNTCTFPLGLQRDNNIFGDKEHKNHYYIVLAILERTKEPALNLAVIGSDIDSWLPLSEWIMEQKWQVDWSRGDQEMPQIISVF